MQSNEYESAEYESNNKTQMKFIKSFDKPLLHEFLCRFKTVNRQSVLSRMIMDELRAQHPSIIAQHTGLEIRTHVNESSRYTNPPDIYTLIEFTNKTLKPSVTKQTMAKTKITSNPQYDYTKIGHITFHLIPTQCGNDTGRGLIHAINDRSTRKVQRVRINTVKTQQCNQYTLSLSTPVIPKHPIEQDMHELSVAALNVLSRWFEPNHPHNSPDNINHKLCNAQARLNTDDVLRKILKWKKHGGTRRKL